MTSPQPPSAVPVPASLDVEVVRELLKDIYDCHRDRDSHDSDWENGVDVPCDWCEKAAIVLRALVPSPAEDLAWRKELFIAAIRTLREHCRVNAVHEAGGHAYRERQHTFMLHLDEALRIIDEPSALVPSPQPATPREEEICPWCEESMRILKPSGGCLTAQLLGFDWHPQCADAYEAAKDAAKAVALPAIQDEAPKKGALGAQDEAIKADEHGERIQCPFCRRWTNHFREMACGWCGATLIRPPATALGASRPSPAEPWRADPAAHICGGVFNEVCHACRAERAAGPSPAQKEPSGVCEIYEHINSSCSKGRLFT